MYFCSVCDSTYENINTAMNCCMNKIQTENPIEHSHIQRDDSTHNNKLFTIKEMVLKNRKEREMIRKESKKRTESFRRKLASCTQIE